jgi:hypothetical protein
MRIAFATCMALADGQKDDRDAAKLAGAQFCVWDDPAVAWDDFDRVVIRSTWDYTLRLDTFLRWCRRVGPDRLRNPLELVEFSADKRYLQHLGVSTVPSVFVAAGDPLPTLTGELVVKPNVSAGARDTGRFAPADHEDAVALIDTIRTSGRVALVQPYLPSVDERGETTIVYIGGERSHEVRKLPILTAAADTSADEPPRPILTPTTATHEERELAAAVHAEMTERFTTPLYARIDMLDDDGQPVLSELEMIEPHLFLSHGPGSARRLAEAILSS